VRHRIGEVVLESEAEAHRLSRIAQAAGVVQDVLVRIAPKQVPRGFGVNMAGRPCQFGIDEEDIDDALSAIRELPGLAIRGFHIYSGTQCLKANAVVENYQIFMDIFRRVCSAHSITPRKLIFGSGLGIPYHDDDAPLDLDHVSSLVLPSLRQFKADPRFSGSELVLEPVAIWWARPAHI
jgi:diaminopimelate decarboxylase